MTNEQDVLNQLQKQFAQNAENVQDMGFTQQVMQHIQQKQRQRRNYWLVAFLIAVIAAVAVCQWLLAPLPVIDIAGITQSAAVMGLMFTAIICLGLVALEN